MPGAWPIGPEQSVETILAPVNCTQGGFAITSSVPGTAKTWSAWTQLIASTASDVCFIDLTLTCQASTTSNTYTIEIGIGPSGSEVTLIPKLTIDAYQFGENFKHWQLPICIPAGTRIAYRVASSGTAAPNFLGIGLKGYDGAFTEMEGAAGIDALAWDATNFYGTSATLSGLTWTQIVSSTPRDYIGFFLSFDGLGTTPPTNNARIGIGLGASGSEQAIITEQQIGQYYPTGPVYTPFKAMPIPAGSRISINGNSGSTNSGVTFYGVYK